MVETLRIPQDSPRSTTEDPMNQQEKNRAVSLAVQESATSGNVERLRELLAPDFKGYFSGNPLGRDEWLGMGAQMMKTFPDGRHEWSLVDAAGDYVILSGFFTGTHRGEFHGIPATGKVVRFSLTIVDKIKDGKLVEHRGEFDSATLMRQLTQ
jgi:predicted ester cyclase